MFDPSEWAVQASGTPEGQRQIAYRQALRLVGQPLVYIVGTLFELGLVVIGKAFVTKIRTPQCTYRVTLTVEYADEDGNCD